MRHSFALLGLVVAVTIASLSPATAEANIWAHDLETAQRRLTAAHDRLDAAAFNEDKATLALPSARADAARLRRVSDRRELAADTVDARATRAEHAVDERRRAALAQVEGSQVQLASLTRAWRSTRTQWISVAALALALAVSVALLVGARRQRSQGVETAERNTALMLAVAVSGYLCVLIGALSEAGVWRFAWWPVAAAAAGTVVMIVATATGRFQGQRAARTAPLAVALPAVLCLALGGAFAFVAVREGRPRAPQFADDTVRLARQATRNAPMPAAVIRLRHRANLVGTRSVRADMRADDAEWARDDLVALGERARAARTRAQRSVERWTREVARVQREYDDYQDQQDALRDLLSPDLEAADDYEDLYGDPLGDPPETSGDEWPSVPPTTEDFGSGSGSVGLCADGTLSDSIGRPGACSHHGGVG